MPVHRYNRPYQYAFAAAITGFGRLGLWVVTRPELAPPFVGG
jgi:hypothetical protein